MAFTFDGVNLRITLESGVPTLDALDLYSRWKDWVKTDDNAKYPIAFFSEGGAPVTGATDQAAYIRLKNDNGWRLRPPEENINILVEGNLIPGDDTLDMVVPTLGTFTALILGLQPIAQGVERVAGQVWDEQLGGHAQAGSTGEALTSAGAGANPGAIADAVWDEGASGHVASGSMGELENRLDASISSLPTVAQIADGVWDEPTVDHVAPGTFGGDNNQLKADVVRMLGLVNENTSWSNMTWDTGVSPPRILSGKITAYTDDTLGTPLTDGGGTIAWQIDQTYNPDGSTATLTYKRVFA